MWHSVQLHVGNLLGAVALGCLPLIVLVDMLLCTEIKGSIIYWAHDKFAKAIICFVGRRIDSLLGRQDISIASLRNQSLLNMGTGDVGF